MPHSKSITPPSPDAIRAAFIAQLSKRQADAESYVDTAAEKLAKFIRKHKDSSFQSIYQITDHGYYDALRNEIALNSEMAAVDNTAGNKFTTFLKTYSNFLQSKDFDKLIKYPKQKPAKHVDGYNALHKEEQGTLESPTLPIERDETEGERTHRELETTYRNPRLRQACINKYGFQCQCCGMDFSELYGEELGSNFIEVHHLVPISTYYTEGAPDDLVENLVPLCSNCHSMIHHITDTEHPLRTLRASYRGEKKEIKVWKED